MNNRNYQVKMLTKLYDILNDIDCSDLVSKYKLSKDKVLQDKTLLALIDKYRVTKDIETKKLILNNTNYIEYKALEKKLLLFSLEVNRIFKSLKKAGQCHENN